MEITIRVIEEKDYRCAHAFQCEYLEREDYDSFIQRVESNPSLYIGAFFNGELVGICYGEPSERESFSICLQGIAVTLDGEKGLARHGIGSELVKRFEEKVREKGYNRISLGSADDDKIEKFYLKNKFQPFEMVVKGLNQEEYERVKIDGYETGIILKQELYRKYHPKEVIFIFQKLL